MNSTVVYRHYKGGLYELYGVTEVAPNLYDTFKTNGSWAIWAEHTELNQLITVVHASGKIYSTDRLVVYRSKKDNKLWARPYDMFFGKLELKGEEVQRFVKVE